MCLDFLLDLDLPLNPMMLACQDLFDDPQLQYSTQCSSRKVILNLSLVVMRKKLMLLRWCLDVLFVPLLLVVKSGALKCEYHRRLVWRTSPDWLLTRMMFLCGDETVYITGRRRRRTEFPQFCHSLAKSNLSFQAIDTFRVELIIYITKIHQKLTDNEIRW